MKTYNQEEFEEQNRINEEEHQKEVNKQQLFRQEEIPGTPFTATKLGEDWFLTMGKYRLTEPLPTYMECVEASKDASWFRLLAITGVVVRESEEVHKLQEEVQKLKEQLENAQNRIVTILMEKDEALLWAKETDNQLNELHTQMAKIAKMLMQPNTEI